MSNVNIHEGQHFKTMSGEVQAHKKLDEGGQGSVWTATYNCSDDYLLKVIPAPNVAIRENAENHKKNRGKLPKDFIWPEDIVKDDSFPGNAIAYVMAKVPGNYKELQKFLWPKGNEDKPEEMFASLDIQLKACATIAKAFHNLQLQGQFYQDLNEKNFLIDPNTGDVKIIDTDNVCDGRLDTGIFGTPGYIAPEVILRKTRPNRRSDLFSLAVILFSIMCRGNPLMGKKYRSYKFPSADEDIFARNPVFVYDDNDMSNRPVAGMDNGVIICWPLCPPEIQQAFKRAFSQEALHNPDKRIECFEWVDILMKVRAELVYCLKCGTYYSDCECPKCKMPKGNFWTIKTAANKEYPIYPGKIFVEHDFCGNREIKPVLRIAKNKTSNCMGIVNLSGSTWNVKIDGNGTSTNKFALKPSQGMDIPSYCDIEINLGDTLKTISINTRSI